MAQIRVLLVDDEEIFVRSILRSLERRGMAVRGAPDGFTALRILGEEEFDVVVLDVMMPGMDGVTALRSIRDLNPAISVILMSGHIGIKQVSEALKAGAAEILLKPCSVETLVASIENACERKRYTDELKDLR
jgi:DNA-binding NtrC family response regulator